jgi:hypothetical protein
MENLPSDLLTEIFRFGRGLSRICCRVVCKKWRHIIDEKILKLDLGCDKNTNRNRTNQEKF